MEEITELYDLFGELVFCNVCYEDVKEGERVRCLSECHHIFHSLCIEKWFHEKTICPTCRKEYVLIFDKESKHNEIIDDIHRLFLTWTIIHGILRKLRTADEFNRNKETIKTICTTFCLLPLELDSRYSFTIMKQYIANRISKNTGIEKNKIHKHPNVYRCIDKIENHAQYNTLVAPLWDF